MSPAGRHDPAPSPLYLPGGVGNPGHMVDGIRAGIRLNHPADAFAPELARIGQVLQAMRLQKGERVTLIAAPGAGLRCQVAGKADAGQE